MAKDNLHSSYQDVLFETSNSVIQWAKGQRNDYPFEEIECLLRLAHATDKDEQMRWFVLDALYIRCMALLNRDQLSRLDYWLHAHARRELTCI